MIAALPFGPGALTFIALYLLSLLYLGWRGRQAQQENTLKDFYLAGSGIGFAVLVFTLYATQYSGNTLFGFTGNAHKNGFGWLVSVHFMTAIIVFYLLFAPWLHRLAKKHSFITPADYLTHRFNCTPLSALASVVMIIAAANYLLAQLIAMGTAVEVLLVFDVKQGMIPTDAATQHTAHTAFVMGVILLTIIMLAYETLGGFRAVAWTDAIQGVILMIGFLILLGIVIHRLGSPADAVEMLATTNQKLIQPPDAKGAWTWLSWILVVGIGGALYPQAIQRIYAANSSNTLRKGLAVMAFMPLLTTLFALLVGVIGAAQQYDLAKDTYILPAIMRDIMASSVAGYCLVVVLAAAIMAALMSTADSVLLIISAMITKDLYARFINPKATEAQLTRLGKWVSLAVVVLMAGLAVGLYHFRDNNILITLMKLKFEMLLQLAPGFILALHWKKLSARAVLAGMTVGLLVAVGLYLGRLADFNFYKQTGIHEGVWGLLANVIVVLGVFLLPSKGRKGERA
jgi:SSS family solute:Na+ symporter